MRFLFAFLLLLPSSLYAQTRAATITGPATAPAGTLVELRGSSEVSSAMTWLTVSDVAYKTYENGSVLVFASPKPGRYEFALIVVVVTADAKPVVSIEKHTVEVTGGGPVPPGPSPPGPQPGPPPSPFAELTSIAKATAPEASKADVRINFRTVATKVAAGTIRDWPSLVSETSAANRASIGDAKDAGHPWNKFFMEIGAKLDEHKKAGRLETPQSWQQAWMAIADGL